MNPDAPILSVEGLGKSYGTNRVLWRVDLSLTEGEAVCVIGPSGSGKTTLLRCFALLEEPSEGWVLMQGQRIAESRPDRKIQAAARAVRSEIGMVFQHFNLWPHMSVLENIIEAPIRARGMSKTEAVEVAERLLEKVGLTNRKDYYPGRLSGGQQQRVAIARALAMSPKVMLFDEPTSALDPELRKEVLQVMKDIAAEGMTMMMVTHEMGFARRFADRIVFMDEGSIVEQGPPSAFFDSPQTARAQRFLSHFQD
jgi:polar amino acid transport system ATP-binding protein